jgi:hypothetical protein
MPLLEQKVLKGVFLIFLPGLVEVIHVQLPDKWCVIVMPEVHGEHGLRELLDFLDDKAFAAAGPWDDVGVFAVLENLVCF